MTFTNPSAAAAQALATTDDIRPADIAAVAAAGHAAHTALDTLIAAWDKAVSGLPVEAHTAVDLALAAKYPLAGDLGETAADFAEWVDHVGHLARVAAAAPYVQAVAAQLATDPAPIAAYLTHHCSECENDITRPDPWHVLVNGNVVIACEGYWVVNPNLVGIPDPGWQDWTQDGGA